MRALLVPVFDQLDARDRRGLDSKDPPKHRHRLMQMVESVRLAAAAFSTGRLYLDLISLAELQVTLEVLNYWRSHPDWGRIPAKVGSEFQHTLMLLAAAKFLAEAGNKVTIVAEKPAGRGRSADLTAGVGLGEKLRLEVKTSQALDRPNGLTADRATVVVKEAFRSARTGEGGQLGPDHPGLLVLGGFHLAERDLRLLERAAAAVLATPPRPHIAGVALLSIGVMLSGSLPDSFDKPVPSGSLNGLLTVRLVSNPLYTGSVRVDQTTRSSELRSRLVGGLGERTVEGWEGRRGGKVP